MKITILGSGTYDPTLLNHSSGYLLEIGDKRICLDFGRGAIDQLLKLGISINEINYLFISHWDPDHVADMLALLHYTRAPQPIELSLVKQRVSPLKIYGPEGTIEGFNHLMSATKGNDDKGFMEVYDLAPGDIVKGEDFELETFQTTHSQKMVCFSYRITSQDKIFSYSGDSGVSEGLKEALKNADLAIVEASIQEEELRGEGHLSGEGAGKIAQEAGVKKLILTHVSSFYRKNGDPVSDAGKYFEREVILGEDLLSFEL